MYVRAKKWISDSISLIIFYNYFTEKLREFYFTIWPKGQSMRGSPWLNKIFSFPEKVVIHNIIVFSDENAEQEIILLNCPKGR